MLKPLVCLLLLPSLAFAQTGTPAGSPAVATPTLKARAQLVLVDVIVTDRNHNPVPNLKQADFTIFENNNPQSLKSFEEHTPFSPADAARLPHHPKLPPGIFTNYSPTPPNSAVNILLLDTLNTPLQDQAYVRQQLLDYLDHARPGANVAIFGLSTQLVMLQGFTSDPEILKEVVKNPHYRASPLLDDAAGGGGVADTASDMNDANGDLLPAEVVANMQTFMNVQQSFQLQLRVKYTLDGMNDLARWLSAIPGRKNLLWFSGSFPLDVLPDISNNPSDPFAGVASSEAEYRETASLLARSQVAVYPIDARGLMISPVLSAQSSGAKYARNPSSFGRDQNTFFTNTAAEHSTMSQMANDTGGRAFFNTNGLSQAVAEVIDSGSRYYTLAYSPTNERARSDYRKIEVRLAQKGYQLEYRRGYYVDAPDSIDSANGAPASTPARTGTASAAPQPNSMQRAMNHGVPGATEILYKVRVVPTTGADESRVVSGNNPNPSGPSAARPPFRRYSVDYAVAAGDLTFTSASDGNYHAAVEFSSVVYQPDGAPVNAMSTTLKINLSPERLRQFLSSGIPCHYEISVPVKGTFSLRNGVHDLASDHVGASEISVARVKNLTPLNASAQPPGQQPPQAK